MTGFPVTPVQMIEDERQNAVWAWCKARPEWRGEVLDGDVEWEYEGMYTWTRFLKYGSWWRRMVVEEDGRNLMGKADADI